VQEGGETRCVDDEDECQLIGRLDQATGTERCRGEKGHQRYAQSGSLDCEGARAEQSQGDREVRWESGRLRRTRRFWRSER
jgi:hypothetical protein